MMMQRWNWYSAAKWVNTFLHNKVGQNTTPGSGWYLNATHYAVRNYQAWWGLYVDGKVGPVTHSHMINVDANY